VGARIKSLPFVLMDVPAYAGRLRKTSPYTTLGEVFLLDCGWRCWPRHHKWIYPSLIARHTAATTMAPTVSEMMMQLKQRRDLGLVFLLEIIAPSPSDDCQPYRRNSVPARVP
jgi:hypothetical protein